MENKCEGCKTFFLDENCCLSGLIPQISETEECPCSKCLIKAICIENCKDYEDYSRLLNPKYTPLDKIRSIL